MTTNNNYGIESTHDFKKEIEDTLRSGMERQTRADMHDEPSHEAVEPRRFRYGEALSKQELEVVYKNGMKLSEYLSNK